VAAAARLFEDDLAALGVAERGGGARGRLGLGEVQLREGERGSRDDDEEDERDDDEAA
jgi:hypothetical protein